MMRSLSILIPVYNKDCSLQIKRLCQLARALTEKGVEVEVVVMEDGSTYEASLRSNAKACAASPLCRHIINKENVGRARVRNRLMCVARGEWLLFQDTGLQVADDFFERFAAALSEHPSARVVCGGLRFREVCPHSLRYCYETATASRRDVAMRRKDPYASMLFSCMLLHRSVAERIHIDERFMTYGYEDVMFGKQLREAHVEVWHIDNPVIDEIDESDEAYVRKTEEAMHTLYAFRDELKSEVRLLQVFEKLRKYVPLSMIVGLHRLFGGLIRRNLAGGNPWWRLFNVYKLGYYACLVSENSRIKRSAFS